MPRAPRINIDDALYYVTSNGMQGQNLFNEGEDYLMYLELLGKYKNQHKFKLYAFALMPGHVHTLIQTQGDTTLSDIMHNVTSSYTKYYNRKYNRQGHLFRGRYRATLIEKDSYLLKIVRYVHSNPKQVGLGADDYLYSSYPVFENRGGLILERINMGQEVKEILELLGDKKFFDFMNEGTHDEGMQLHKELRGNLFLGSEDFGKKVKEYIDKASAGDESAGEEMGRAKKILVPLVSVLLLATLAGSGLVYYQKTKADAQKKKALEEQVVDFIVQGLDGYVWQIKFVAGAPLQIIDNLYFDKGKMFSDNLSLNGYPETNYSVSRRDKMLIWETMQASAAGTAFWRGEAQDGQMKGSLSLRPSHGEPQEFSFVSLKYKKIEKVDSSKN